MLIRSVERWIILEVKEEGGDRRPLSIVEEFVLAHAIEPAIAGGMERGQDADNAHGRTLGVLKQGE